jgi:hypothetical protein
MAFASMGKAHASKSRIMISKKIYFTCPIIEKIPLFGITYRLHVFSATQIGRAQFNV